MSKCKKHVGVCEIYRVFEGRGSGKYYQEPFAAYVFTVDDKNFGNIVNLTDKFQDRFKDSILHKTFPVIYCEDNPNECEILIRRETFGQYGLAFPDSLAWIKGYLK